ncbi:HEAT repeat domain-containing protein [Thermincola ferriacetica]
MDQDNILTPPFEEYDVHTLPNQLWWKRFSLEKAIKMIEADKDISYWRDTGNPSYMAVEQLILYVLYSNDPEEQKTASSKLDELLNRDIRYVQLIGIVSNNLASEGNKVDEFLRGKEEIFLDYVNDSQAEALQEQFGEDLRPIIAAQVLGKTGSPRAIPLLAEWIKSERIDLKLAAQSALFDLNLWEAFKLLAEYYGTFKKASRKKLIEALGRFPEGKKLLTEIKAKETHTDLIEKINTMLS